MENEHLRTAITRAGLTLEEFADIVQVDVKTVQRWLAGRTPYPRNRARVASALDTTEHALWPDAVPAPTDVRSARADDTRRPATWSRATGTRPTPPHRIPPSSCAQRSSGSRSSSPTSHPSPGSSRSCAHSAADGCRIASIIEDPDGQVEPLLGIDAIEVRASPAGEDHVLYRADDEMLLALSTHRLRRRSRHR